MLVMGTLVDTFLESALCSSVVKAEYMNLSEAFEVLVRYRQVYLYILCKAPFLGQCTYATFLTVSNVFCIVTGFHSG